MSVPVSVLFIAKNEADRLEPALASVRWADEVIVADTGSTDGTAVVAANGGARVVKIPWEGFVGSRNRVLEEAAHDWVLFLDADEEVSVRLRDEIRERLERNEGRWAGFAMPRLSHFMGRDIRHGTWYPDVKLRLGRRSLGFRAVGGRVHEHFVVDGAAARLSADLLHRPYRNLSDAIRKVSTYSRLGAEDRFDRGMRARIGSLVARPAIEFFRSFLLKLGFLDGQAGFAVAAIHAWSYFLRAAFLFEAEKGWKQTLQARREDADRDVDRPEGSAKGPAVAL